MATTFRSVSSIRLLMDRLVTSEVARHSMHTEDSLKVLKVQQLKAICKEIKILNYSKLGKAELITRIVNAVQQPQGQNPILLTKTSVDQAGQGEARPLDQQGEAASPIIAHRVKRPDIGRAKDLYNNKITDLALSTQLDEPSRQLTQVLETSTIKQPNSRNKHSGPSPLPTAASIEPARRMKKRTFLPPATVPDISKCRYAPEQKIEELDLTGGGVYSNIADRVRWMETSFIERLFMNLNEGRVRPVKRPPYPSAITHDGSSPTRHLAFQGIHPGIYLAIDGRDYLVALRFWLARLHTMSRLGSTEAWAVDGRGMGLLGPDLATWPAIASCRAVSKDVWEVITDCGGYGAGTERFLVVGMNGDVIARTRIPEEAGDVRADWSAHIRDGSARSLSECVKTKDPHAFPGGISRRWLAQTCDSTANLDLQRVAQRAIMSSCSLNSFSGTQLSAVQMEAEWLGHSQSASRTAKDRLELFLPESHQVLSVHLPPPPFHSALAIVTRGSGDSIIVLRETGQEIGLEDSGVAELWQGILGCNEKGMNDTSGAEAFWAGWEARVRGME